jgi:hypothetical protein
MRHFSRGHRALAGLLALSIGTAGMSAFASPSTARLAGRILQSGAGTGIENAVVKVSLRPDARVYQSSRTDAKGSYALSGLPSGTYDVAVESSGGLYVTPAPLSLVAGEKRDLSLAIHPQTQKGENRAEGDPAPPPPAPTEPPAPAPAEPTTPPPEPPKEPAHPPADQQPKKKVPFYRTPWGGALIVVGTAVIVGAVAHSSDDSEPATASPSED